MNFWCENGDRPSDNSFRRRHGVAASPLPETEPANGNRENRQGEGPVRFGLARPAIAVTLTLSPVQRHKKPARTPQREATEQNNCLALDVDVTHLSDSTSFEPDESSEPDE